MPKSDVKPFDIITFQRFLHSNWEGNFDYEFAGTAFLVKRLVDKNGGFEEMCQKNSWKEVEEGEFPSDTEFRLLDDCGEPISLLDFFTKYLMEDFLRDSVGSVWEPGQHANMLFFDEKEEVAFPDGQMLRKLNAFGGNCRMVQLSRSGDQALKARAEEGFGGGEREIVASAQTSLKTTQIVAETWDEVNLLEAVRFTHSERVLSLITGLFIPQSIEEMDAEDDIHVVNLGPAQVQVYVFTMNDKSDETELILRLLANVSSGDQLFSKLVSAPVELTTFTLNPKEHLSSSGSMMYVFKAKGNTEVAVTKMLSFDQNRLQRLIKRGFVYDFEGERKVIDWEFVRVTLKDSLHSKDAFALVENALQEEFRGVVKSLSAKYDTVPIYQTKLDISEFICYVCGRSPFSVAAESADGLRCISCSRERAETGIDIEVEDSAVGERIVCKSLLGLLQGLIRDDSSISNQIRQQCANITVSMSRLIPHLSDYYKFPSKYTGEEPNFMRIINETDTILRTLTSKSSDQSVCLGTWLLLSFSGIYAKNVRICIAPALVEYLEHPDTNRVLNYPERDLRAQIIRLLPQYLNELIESYIKDADCSELEEETVNRLHLLKEELCKEKDKLESMYLSVVASKSTLTGTVQANVDIKNGCMLYTNLLRTLLVLSRQNFEVGELGQWTFGPVSFTEGIRVIVNQIGRFLE